MRPDLPKCFQHAIMAPLLLFCSLAFHFAPCWTALYFATVCCLVWSVFCFSLTAKICDEHSLFLLYLHIPVSLIRPHLLSLSRLLYSWVPFSIFSLSFLRTSLFRSLPPFVKSNMSDLWSAEATGGNQLSLLHYSYVPPRLLPPSVHPPHLTQQTSGATPARTRTLNLCPRLSPRRCQQRLILSFFVCPLRPSLRSARINSLSAPRSPFC